MSGTQIHVKQWEQQSGTSQLGFVREKCSECSVGRENALSVVDLSQGIPANTSRFPRYLPLLVMIYLRGLKALVEDHKCVTQVSLNTPAEHRVWGQWVPVVLLHNCSVMEWLWPFWYTHFNCFPELYTNKNPSHTHRRHFRHHSLKWHLASIKIATSMKIWDNCTMVKHSGTSG